jgi:hypothetical protein
MGIFLAAESWVSLSSEPGVFVVLILLAVILFWAPAWLYCADGSTPISNLEDRVRCAPLLEVRGCS